ncbi:hypothetical protein NE579_16800, partial [Intestinimonas massiliensis]
AVKGGTGYTKCGGNYAASIRAGERAEKQGYAQDRYSRHDSLVWNLCLNLSKLIPLCCAIALPSLLWLHIKCWMMSLGELVAPRKGRVD